ncbi:XRE family transcriptional regulator [Sebaldella sp. S0638]|uniref:helix-turn-helix domain-containing protein n=1 Tax=Sebaldella sp. S0638 TaxID=2957809 RepID=UPI00209C7BB3|nr:XRE family transcriptional regulator [Sebaldella sp. S0638]MCP1225406.1 XRE family transcriptional regulator [Sebaldella sp. S0638]
MKKQSLGEVLREARERKGYSFEKLSLLMKSQGVKISESGLYKIESGKTKSPDIKILKKYCEIFSLDFNIVFKLAGIDLTELSELMKLRNENEKIEIPLYGSASAGNGFLNLDVEIGKFEIPEKDYREDYYAVKVVGESMVGSNGIIPNGSIALVNPNCLEYNDYNKKIFIFTYKEETYIKQAIVDEQDILRLRSFNSEYQDVIVLDENELICHGRVIKIYYNAIF